MSICEDRITEDSTEFEKEFLEIYDDNLWNALDKMKDWQPPIPKPYIEVPQFVADWFEYQLKNNNDLDKFDGNDVFRIIQDVIKVSNDESTWEDYGITDEIAKFAEDNEELFLNLIVNCSLGNGYTVEKPKENLYVVKLPGVPTLNSYMCKSCSPGELGYNEKYSSKNFNEVRFGLRYYKKYSGGWQRQFTEQEIKDIDPRYLAFSVKVEED